ncbi:MAG: type VI secretion system tip protein VgrG [Planctomycetes bacterium]|nr:type VI secretion system tip protein VgrG [Planctomycetota bacterium]
MATYTQDKRFCSFASPLGENALLLRWLNASERVSALSSATVGLRSERDDIDPHELVGQGAAVAIETASGERRYLHGIVTRFLQGGRSARLVDYQAELRPWLWLLTRRNNCRIFQQKTVQQIVEQVFEDAGQSDFEFKLNGSYTARNYCVQYRETDFAFVSRLLEDEGIFYFVRHEADRHVVVLVDSPSSVPDCPGQAEVDYHTASGQVGRDVITEWTSSQELHAGKVALKDYNFEDPGNALLVTDSTADAIGDNGAHEVYDYHPELYPDTGAGTPIARIRMEQRETVGVRVAGEATCRAFAAGHTFTLQNHYRQDLNGKRFLILAVEHTLNQPSDVYSEAGDEPSVYENRFVCVPADLPHRPERSTQKPFVRGPQTAVVVGPAGEEIHVDQYGRIKVQFHWDREGSRDDNSSCWIRVSQAWAGKQWGALAHPRIGDEVIVEHLEGDPDKPIVTGCVYNAQQMPPYELPGNKTQSGLKSRSSPGGSASNFNEIRFEDKIGNEEVFIQAEKNKTVNVKNDRTETVGNDESITIGNNRTEQVGVDESITIGSNRTENVGADETITIGANRTENVGSNETITIGSNRTENVGSNETITIGANRSENVGSNETVTIAMLRTHSIGVNDMLNVGAAQEVSIGGLRALTIGAADTVSVGGARTTTIGGGDTISAKTRKQDIAENDQVSIGKSLAIDVGEQIVLQTGQAKILMKKDGSILLEGKDIKIKASGKIEAAASGELKLKGSKIVQN